MSAGYSTVVKPSSLPFYFFHKHSHNIPACLVVDSVQPSLDNNFEQYLSVRIADHQLEAIDLSLAHPLPSKCANRLPILPEYFILHHPFKFLLAFRHVIELFISPIPPFTPLP